MNNSHPSSVFTDAIDRQFLEAVEAGNVFLAKVTLEADADLYAKTEGRDWSGRLGALEIAALKGHLEMVIFLEGEYKRDALNYVFAFECAAEAGHLDVVKFLFEKWRAGKEGNIETKDLEVAFVYSAEAGHIKVAQYLLEQSVDPDANNFSPIITASHKGDIDMCRLLIAYGASVDAVIDVGERELGAPVYNACKQGSKRLLNLLIAAGADIHIQNDFIFSELLADGNLPAIEMLHNVAPVYYDDFIRRSDSHENIQAHFDRKKIGDAYSRQSRTCRL